MLEGVGEPAAGPEKVEEHAGIHASESETDDTRTSDAAAASGATQPAAGPMVMQPAAAPTAPVPTLSIKQIADQASISGEAATPALVRVGFNLTIALLLLIVGVFIWVMIYAAMTRPPSLASVKEFFPGDTAKAFDSYERLRTSWLSQIKDLLQLLVVSLLVPLVATVIGYIFGRREAGRSTD